jgi:hypothetical protein
MALAGEATEKLSHFRPSSAPDYRTTSGKLSEWLLNSGAYMH